MRLPPEIDDFLIHFCLGRIGMDRSGDCLRAGSGFHRHRKFTDHFACVGRHDRGAKNLVCAFLNVNSRKTLVFSVENRTIDFIKLVGVGFDLETLLLRILLIHPNMRNLRLRERAPGHDQGFDGGVAQAQGMRE